jgi:hypothetical protein
LLLALSFVLMWQATNIEPHGAQARGLQGGRFGKKSWRANAPSDATAPGPDQRLTTADC